VTRLQDCTIGGYRYLMPGVDGMAIYYFGLLSDRWRLPWMPWLPQ
jgi:hypothetical protein